MRRNALDDLVLGLLRPYAHPHYPVGENSMRLLLIEDRKLLSHFLLVPRSKKTAIERPLSPGGRTMTPQYDYRIKMWEYLREGWGLYLKEYDRATIPVLEATANYLEQQRI